MSDADQSNNVKYARSWADRPPRPPTAYPLLITVIILILAPLVLASQITAHLRLDVVDDQMFGYYGWRIAHGATIYLDIWDNKPPGIYWVNALGFLIGNDSYGGVIALCVTALLVTHVSFFVICASVYYRGAAALATVLAGFYLTHSFYQCGTNRTETFLVAFEVTAAAFYCRGCARDRWWIWLVAGVLAGCAFLFKQVGLVVWGAMGLHSIILVCTRDLSIRAGLRRCLLLLLGAAAPIAVAYAALAAQNAADEALWAIFTFNRFYFAAGESSWFDNTEAFVLLKNHLRVLKLPLLMAAAAGIHALLWSLRPSERPPDITPRLAAIGPVVPRYMLLFTIWLVASTYGAVLSPHSFRHYLVPVIPPLMLFAGYLVNVLAAEIGLVRRMQQRAWISACVVAIAYFAGYALQRQWEEVSKVYVFRIEQGEVPEWETLAQAVVEVTGPDDTIQCWGYLPGVYLHSRRINASRFTTTEKIGQLRDHPVAGRIERELKATIMSQPPAVFVISMGDYEWLNGRKPNGEVVAPDPFGEWLAENYEQVNELRGIFVLKRRTSAS